MPESEVCPASCIRHRPKCACIARSRGVIGDVDWFFGGFARRKTRDDVQDCASSNYLETLRERAPA